VTDNCSPPQSIKLSNSWPVGKNLTSGCNNAATVNFYATDACGNVSPPELGTFRVLDTTPPSITNATDLSVECDDSAVNSYQSWLASHGGATGSDVCGNVTWSYIGPSTISKGCDVVQTVTFIATDTCNLTTVTTATFSIVDSDPPRIINTATDQNTTCSTSTNQTLNSWLNSHGGAVAVDDCTNVTWSNNYESLTGVCTLSALVVFVASDQCGNNVSTVATFAVVDTTPPIITSPAVPVSVPCDSNTQSTFNNFLNTHGGAVAYDPCQPASNLQWSNNFASAPTSCGTISVTFAVTDGCGSFAYTTASFTVTDHFAPTISPPAQSISVECDGYGNVNDYNFWVSTHGESGAVDTCALNLTWSTNAPLTGPVGCGSIDATFSVSDSCNNAASTSATFTVVDTIPPTIFPVATDTVVQCDGEGNIADITLWLSTHAGASATDLCSGSDIIWTYTLTSESNDQFSCTNFSFYTFTATDQCGNFADSEASFGITDSLPPVFSLEPSNLNINCGASNANQINNWLADNGGAVATDNCSDITYSNSYVQQVNPGFGCFNLPVTFTATDSCGHSSNAIANLTLVDATNPVFTNFPPALTLPCDADTSVASTGYPGVSDSCFSNLAPLIVYTDTLSDLPPNPNTPLCPGNHIITRTFSVTDPCGNSVSQNQIITVEIARSAGACDSSNCVCNNECCPEPQAVDCTPTDCLPQSCSPSYCTPVQCSCGFGKRDLREEFPIDFVNAPIPQCEPVYIFVHDDDAEDDDDNGDAVALSNLKLDNYLISEHPIPQEELEKMKNRNHNKHKSI
jgi:hypothetical protein